MKKKASKLIFISRISPDGLTISPISDEKQLYLQCAKYIDDKYTLNSLSISNGTYVASGCSSYVVKLKPKDK